MKQAVIGLDTSNYRTSLAVVTTDGDILLNDRELLQVAAGEKGLRQSDAVFAHLKRLNAVSETLREAVRGTEVLAVAASDRPRDGAESYMPVFLVGASFGKAVAAALDVPFIATTHQRGHLAAAMAGTRLEGAENLLALHLSGGTTDLLAMEAGRITQIGGSLDLHAGQMVDRAGVAMGLGFPAGPELEALAREGKSGARLGCSMEQGDLYCHFSGAETRIRQWIREESVSREDAAREVYDLLARTIARMLAAGAAKTGIRKALVTGGVASSELFREMLAERLRKTRNAPDAVFGAPEMSGDNAVGVARIGIKEIKE
ncbi:MAG: O-sialoglycoprotein endopeptidase [Clostridiales bacterium]|nr:O-sialoglycoprotein endopeptidase [Clostridiales bacterium]